MTKLRTHINVVINTIVGGLMLKNEKIQIAIEPFKTKSNTDKKGLLRRLNRQR